MKNLVRLFVSLALVMGIVSCGVTDDPELCETGDLELKFKYKYVDAGGSEDVTDLIDEIYLYVFEQSTGILTDVLLISSKDLKDGSIEAELAVGEYTFVAWGFSKTEFKKGGFSDVHMMDSVTHRYTPVVIGETTIDDFRVMIVDPEGGFSDLFHAIREDIAITPALASKAGTKIIPVEFDFVRFNSTLQVKVKGIQYINPLVTRAEPHLPLDIFVTGKKGTYTHAGSIDRYAPELRYNTKTKSLSDSETEMDIRLLRLDVQHHVQNPVMLHLHSTNTTRANNNIHVIPDIDVLQAIFQVRNEKGEYIYRDQVDIDRTEFFPIEITILQDLTIEITVDGFVVHDLDPML